jgi:nucleoside-diphosphate-sugar epimerase
MARRAVVTGSSGYLGMTLVERLASHGWRIDGVDLRSPPMKLPTGASWIKGDVCNEAFMASVIDRADAVFHLAAIISLDRNAIDRMSYVNIVGTRTVLSVAKRTKHTRIICCGTLRAATCPVNRLVAYERTKLTALACAEAAATNGADVVTVNPAGLLGPGDYTPSLAGRFLLALWLGELPLLVTGHQNWVDVRDVADAFLWAVESAPPGTRGLISGHETSISALALCASRVAGGTAPRLSVPRPVVSLIAPLMRSLSTPHGPPITRDALALIRPVPPPTGISGTEMPVQVRPLALTLSDTYRFFETVGLLHT